MEQESIQVITYSPAAVLNLFNNSISVTATKRIIQLRGIYVQGKGSVYSGYFYDTFRDESSDAQITILVPPLIRNKLQPNKTVTVNGFITRRIVNASGSIQIQLTVTDLVAQTQNRFSDDEIRKIELLQAKAQAGFRDVSFWLKERILHEQAFRIAVIIGKTGIIDNDIKHQLGESIAYYDLSFHRVNLSSEEEIINAMQQLDAERYDIVAVSRGGGENMEVFNRFALAEKATNLEALFVTAIGHKDDVSLLQKVADKSFITPSDFGSFLNETYNHTIEEAQHSRAQLVESVTKQLTAVHQKELENLRAQVKNLEELKKQSTTDMQKVYEEKIGNLNALQQDRQRMYEQQLNSYQSQLTMLEKRGNFNWMAVIVAIVVGLIVGYLLKGH